MFEIQLDIYKIFFTNQVLELLNSYEQDTPLKHESGGVLLGQVRKNEIYVLQATAPQKFDKSTRFSFLRHKKSVQPIIDREFYDSGKKTIYLGEWHTHPENNPTPSGTDLEMIKRQFYKNKINENWLLLVIQGLEGTYVGLYNGSIITSKFIEKLKD